MPLPLDQDRPRDVSRLVIPDVGGFEATSTLNGVRLVDGDGLEVLAVTEYLASLLASGASPASLRSYAMALLRWWRFLGAVEVAWDRATRTDVRDFVLWMRSTTRSRARSGKATTAGGSTGIGRGYAPATINHNLAVGSPRE